MEKSDLHPPPISPSATQKALSQEKKEASRLKKVAEARFLGELKIQESSLSKKSITQKKSREAAHIQRQFHKNVTKNSGQWSEMSHEQKAFICRLMTHTLSKKGNLELHALVKEYKMRTREKGRSPLDRKIANVQLSVIQKEIESRSNRAVLDFFENNFVGVFGHKTAERLLDDYCVGTWLLRKDKTGTYFFSKKQENGIKSLPVDPSSISHIRNVTRYFPLVNQIDGLVQDFRNHGIMKKETAEALLYGEKRGTWLLYQCEERGGAPFISQVTHKGKVRHKKIPADEAAVSIQKNPKTGEVTYSNPFQNLKTKYGNDGAGYLIPEHYRKSRLDKFLRAAERARDLIPKEGGAKVLGRPYRAEYLDDEHGYGPHLEPWWKEWAQNDGIQDSFSSWLSKIRNGERPLGSEFVQDHDIHSVSKVTYFNEDERADYELVCREGLLYNASSNRPIDCREGESYIFVQEPGGKLYAAPYERGVLNHTSFLAGAPVLAAGKFIAQNGKITEISDKSGHYATTLTMFCQGIEAIQELGADLTKAKVERFDSQGYYQDPRFVDEIKEEAVSLLEFADRHRLKRGFKEARADLLRKPRGSWNLVYSKEMQDFILSYKDRSGAIASEQLSLIHQTTETIIGYLESGRADLLSKLSPYMGMTREMKEKIAELKVEPFPLNLDLSLLEDFLSRRPEGTWLIHRSDKIGAGLSINKRDGVHHYLLLKQMEKGMKDFDPDMALGFDETVLREMTDFIVERNLKKLDVIPFPQSFSHAKIIEALEREPYGAWLTKESSSGAPYVFYHHMGKVGVTRINRLNKHFTALLRHDLKISYNANLDDPFYGGNLYDHLKQIALGPMTTDQAKEVLKHAPQQSWIVRFSESDNLYVVMKKTGPERDHVIQKRLNPAGSLRKFRALFPSKKLYL